MSRHIPYLWRYRLLRKLHAPQRRASYRMFHAWARAEGGTARYNPLNTTEHWPGATPYNTRPDGTPLVLNYPTGLDGIEATYLTLTNGNYDGIIASLRSGRLSAKGIVLKNAREFDKWGTGSQHILELL